MAKERPSPKIGHRDLGTSSRQALPCGILGNWIDQTWRQTVFELEAVLLRLFDCDITIGDYDLIGTCTGVRIKLLGRLRETGVLSDSVVQNNSVSGKIVNLYLTADHSWLTGSNLCCTTSALHLML